MSARRMDTMRIMWKPHCERPRATLPAARIARRSIERLFNCNSAVWFMALPIARKAGNETYGVYHDIDRVLTSASNVSFVG